MSRDTLITIYGVVAVSFMMTMYALERRHPAFILAFAAGCLASAAYGFLSGAWPFGVVEAIWAVVAMRRYQQRRRNIATSEGNGVKGNGVGGREKQ
jgi:hypothetical protein